ncbi:nicotinate-nucleotide adenylyltransferase [Seonamhaeicola marinus]|uniref:Nicotinate-nucleotide adenylyltransferase n=1 Tax=Seonamhaeicola marinus TaxID=1912246 RepID=A0A5D0I4N6_9FLAO|nr:nicotinate-nucleotide adenylyltransferase [Seonamhaeicola marinus]TYA78703.1 nicotinate-nucleotide adenylyltransferase [Seonamhaeicola marinus]
MKTLFASLLTLCATYFVSSQTIELPNTLITVNYDYASIEDDNQAVSVKKLKDKVANFDCTLIADLFDDKNDVYSVTFSAKDGKIIASFNKDGKIVSTIEKFNNVRLPLEVMQSICSKYPNWGIIEDVYLLKYNSVKGVATEEYKVKIKNEEKVLTIRTNEKGDFI